MSRPQPIVKDGRFVNPFQQRSSFWSVMVGFLRGKNNSGIPSAEVSNGRKKGDELAQERESVCEREKRECVCV